MKDSELKELTFKVSKLLYEKIYDDPWFSKLFRNIDQEVITSQQSDFMTGVLGGPKNFCGRMPKDAHPQIWIDENIWEYRENILKETFEELNVPTDIREKWLKIDNAFKHAIINKAGPQECFGRYKTEEIIYEPMPAHLQTKKTA